MPHHCAVDDRALGLLMRDREDVLDWIASLFRRPAWAADAACAEHPLEIFFPGAGASTLSRARQICDGCLVRDDCAEWALAQGVELRGVWAGMSERDRRRRIRSQAA